MNPINISTSPAILRWQPAAWLQISGADAGVFLQGQFTNELRGLAAGAEVYGLWLTVKGKVLADSFVVRGAGAEEFWVGSYFSTAAVIRERLEAFVIADDVVIEDRTAEWSGLSIVGEGAAAWLGQAPAGGVAFAGRRARGENVEWVAPRAVLAEAGAQLAELSELDAGAAEARRIAEGIPAVPRDIGPADLPNEGGLEADAISYTKGCYLGQEVMARLKSMGQVRRRLVRVEIAAEAGAPPATPAALFAGPKQAGELRSVAPNPAGGGWIGLAMVSLLTVGAVSGSGLSFATDGAPVVRLKDPIA
ncbi:MAG: folate-binding protein [Verrucomicrobiota bacterium]